MRQILLCLMLGILVAGCNQDENGCDTVWQIDRNDLSSFARIDSSQLEMEVWNATTPNSIILTQSVLASDFELSINLLEFEWDSVVQPQFRLEVFDNSEAVSGVAINADAFYCYVGEPQNRDMRIMHGHTGPLQISREDEMITCSGSFGGVDLSFTDTLHSEELSVRLVLGATNTVNGQSRVVLDDFNILGQTEMTVKPDDFSCISW